MKALLPGHPPGHGQTQEKPPEPHPPEDAGEDEPEDPHCEEKTEKIFSVSVFPHRGQGGDPLLPPPALNFSKVESQERQRYSNIGMVLTSQLF